MGIKPYKLMNIKTNKLPPTEIAKKTHKKTYKNSDAKIEEQILE